jgi:hypothetical protein
MCGLLANVSHSLPQDLSGRFRATISGSSVSGVWPIGDRPIFKGYEVRSNSIASGMMHTWRFVTPLAHLCESSRHGMVHKKLYDEFNLDGIEWKEPAGNNERQFIVARSRPDGGRCVRFLSQTATNRTSQKDS